MTLIRLLLWCPVVSLLFLGVGCVSSSSPPEVQRLSTVPPHKICRIAVLPFVNHTDYAHGDVIVYRIFVAEMNRRGGFSVAQEGDIRKILRQMKLSPKETPGYEQTMVLADRLDVDALIIGEITTMHEEKGMKETKPELAVDLRLIPAGSTRPWLTIYHRRGGEEYRKVMHFGLVNTMTTLATMVADEVLEIWQAKGLTPCGS